MNGGSSIILSIIFSLLCSIVEAGIFLKVKEPLIVQEAVWIYSNSTAITQLALDVPANKFSKSIAPLNNVPEAMTDGTIGVLYNRDDSCSPDTLNTSTPWPFYAPTPKLSEVPKIAFIKKQGGSCTLAQKILNAQSEGAIGAIVYDTTANGTTFEDRKAGVPLESGITIPAYYVDYSVGVELYHQLEKMAGVPIATIPAFDNVNLTTRISVRIALMPADNVKPCAWELTLLVMLILLGTSIFFSVLMQFYMWKKNQRLQSVVERHRPSDYAANPLPMGKALLAIARLYEFPTRVIDTLPDEEERKKVETVLSDEKQLEALIKTTTLISNESTIKQKSLFSKKLQRPSLPTSTVVKIDAPINNMCVICLEAFKIGDEIRELPCHHEFHSGTCIDPWLTSKSGECPLCKFDCSAASDTKSQETLTPEQSAKGICGMYQRFMASRKKRRFGQVAPRGDIEQQRTIVSRQSTLIQEAPPSPGLRGALRAVEAIETVPQQITRVADAEAAIDAATAAETTTANEVAKDSSQKTEEEALTTNTHQEDGNNYLRQEEHDNVEPPPRPSTATSNQPHHKEEEEAQPRMSTATNRSIITTTGAQSTIGYVPSVARDGGLLPDINVSSISLCSIDLGGGLLSEEDFHNTFNNHK